MLTQSFKTSLMRKLVFGYLIAISFLTLANVEAQTNVALNKRATQSSNYTSSAGQPSKAVDGNTNGNWSGRSVTHTAGNFQKNPWWTVDLGGIYDINKIQIWNRTDCCRARLDNMKILIKKRPNDSWSRFNSSNHRYRSGETYPLTFNGNRQARYVMIQLETSRGILSLAEVKVFGTPVSENITISFAKATQVGSPRNCQSGSFKDPIDGGTCWTCPSGFRRTVFSVKSDKACERAASEVFAKAIFKKHFSVIDPCKGGQFADVTTGKCYSCPSGYRQVVLANVNSPKKCVKTVPASYSRATKVGKYGGCDRGFYDVGTNKCWTCPSGYKRTVFAVTGSKACEKISAN